MQRRARPPSSHLQLNRDPVRAARVIQYERTGPASPCFATQPKSVRCPPYFRDLARDPAGWGGTAEEAVFNLLQHEFHEGVRAADGNADDGRFVEVPEPDGTKGFADRLQPTSSSAQPDTPAVVQGDCLERQFRFHLAVSKAHPHEGHGGGTPGFTLKAFPQKAPLSGFRQCDKRVRPQLAPSRRRSTISGP